MEPLLGDTGQFIVASVTYLITATVAQYVLRLEGIGRELIEKGEKGGTVDTSRLTVIVNRWRWLWSGWWLLTAAAIAAAVRILVSPLYQALWLDVVVLVLMLAGYIALAVVAWKSWKWSQFGSRDFAAMVTGDR